MIITEQQIQSLRKILPDTADELLASNDAMLILDALDDLYITLLDSYEIKYTGIISTKIDNRQAKARRFSYAKKHKKQPKNRT